MPRHSASDLILRTRLGLERLRTGSFDRRVIIHLAQASIICGHIARAGHSRLPPAMFEAVEQTLGQILLDFDETATSTSPDNDVLDALTAVVNEYDRMLGTVRLELFARASDYLDRLIELGKKESDGRDENVAEP